MDILDANAASTNAAIDAATPMTTAGDLTIGGASGTPTRLGIGAAGQHLAVVAGAPAWAPATPMTTPGDLIVGGVAGAMARLGVGAETQALSVVGGVPAWVAPTYGGMTNPMTAAGDLILGGASGAANRLAKGADGQVLSVAAGVVGWAAPPVVQNLVTNPGFEIWQRGAGPFTAHDAYNADRWQNTVGTSTLSVSRITSTIGFNGFSAQLAYTHVGGGNGGLYQKIEWGFGQLQNQSVTFAITIKSTVAARVRAFVFDNVSSYRYSAYNVGTGPERLSVTAPIAATAATAWVGVWIDTGTCTVEVNDAVAVTGLSAPPYTPLHPQDDLARCLRYYAALGGQFATEDAIALFCISATQALGVWRLPVEMAAAPLAVTVSAPGHWAVYNAAGAALACTALAGSQMTTRSLRLTATVAAGLVAGNATELFANVTTNARVSVETGA